MQTTGVGAAAFEGSQNNLKPFILKKSPVQKGSAVGINQAPFWGTNQI